jgi:hypothetical protein
VAAVAGIKVGDPGAVVAVAVVDMKRQPPHIILRRNGTSYPTKTATKSARNVTRKANLAEQSALSQNSQPNNSQPPSSAQSKRPLTMQRTVIIIQRPSRTLRLATHLEAKRVQSVAKSNDSTWQRTIPQNNASCHETKQLYLNSTKLLNIILRDANLTFTLTLVLWAQILPLSLTQDAFAMYPPIMHKLIPLSGIFQLLAQRLPLHARNPA